MKLTKNYIEKIATHWARKRIETVEQAMAITREEHKQYIQWANSKRKKNQDNELHMISKIDSIKGAIKSGLNDEQLGRYVRTLLSKED